MKYIYGYFTNKQIKEAANAMHNDIHKLLLYKDNTIEETIFENDEAFLVYFDHLLENFGGVHTLFNNNGIMVKLMSTLQAARNEVASDDFHYGTFRREILDSHGYIKQMFEEGDAYAKSINS